MESKNRKPAHGTRIEDNRVNRTSEWGRKMSNYGRFADQRILAALTTMIGRLVLMLGAIIRVRVIAIAIAVTASAARLSWPGTVVGDRW